MRLRMAFLSCTLVAAAPLLAATSATTSTNLPTSCTLILNDDGTANDSDDGTWTVSVLKGPTFVTCDAPSGQCTEIQYQITGATRAAHLAVLEGLGVFYVRGGGDNRSFAPCVGDRATELGEHSCHEQAVSLEPNGATATLTIGLEGQRKASPSSIAVRNGRHIQACEIEGIGVEGDQSPFQTTQKTETKIFEGCAVTFKFDSAGNVLSAANDPSQSDPNQTCTGLITTTVDKLTVTLDLGNGPVSLGSGQFGDGYISTGSASCTSRVIAGRVYTWGAPCP